MYGGGAGDLAGGDSERTAFRKAEKVYKLYKSSARRSRQKQSLLRQTDLSGVVDFAAVLDDFHLGGDPPPGIIRLRCSDFPASVFCFGDRPGFFFIPGALSVEEQCRWVRESLAAFPEPPNRTNHTTIYGPLCGLLDAARRNKFLAEIEAPPAEGGASPGPIHSPDELGAGAARLPGSWRPWNVDSTAPRHSFVGDGEGRPCEPLLPALSLLRKLRWSTLGFQFDWSKRSYDVSLPRNEIPPALCSLAKKMAAPAMPPGEEFRPEAAIVNYFGPSDMLGGHLDDMEADWSKPIVSISLGCKAVFLLGGKSREDPPLAMLLRSGDVVLMAGEARECFHGVPRIFTDAENADVSSLASLLSGEDDRCLNDYIRTSRVNINIRQVF
ncbi:unnamed protein product [Spirodela intermedia]|uniref:Fe2OG dioxygenase domain-containing protein n=1 Tax=Spirodela intermedia TaxID=51605 RepID=A0A7I8L4Z4_SPIIN|nr:unnamed protein product [Spirodela intermedia]